MFIKKKYLMDYFYPIQLDSK